MSFGEKAGVYALGQIIANPAVIMIDADHNKYWLDKKAMAKFSNNKSVLVKYLIYTKEKPILEAVCHVDICLSGLQIFSIRKQQIFPFNLNNIKELVD